MTRWRSKLPMAKHEANFLTRALVANLGPLGRAKKLMKFIEEPTDVDWDAKLPHRN